MNLNSNLQQLEKSGLIRLLRSLPEVEYLFRHALIQDAAYSTLVKPDRQRLHSWVGETLEQTYPDQLDDLAGLLAYHFGQARNLDKAIEYSRRAAHRAVATYAY